LSIYSPALGQDQTGYDALKGVKGGTTNTNDIGVSPKDIGHPPLPFKGNFKAASNRRSRKIKNPGNAMERANASDVASKVSLET